MAALRVYFDESQPEGDESVSVVAGFIGEQDAWERTEERWVKALDDLGWSHFHYTDWENRRAGSPWDHLEREVRLPMAKKLFSVLSDAALIPVAYAFKGRWKDFRPENPFWNASRFPSGYSWCAEMAFQLACDAYPNFKSTDGINFVFDNTSAKYRSRMQRYQHIFSVADDRYNIPTGLAFESAIDVPALQIADALAYELLLWFDKPHNWFTFPLLEILWSSDVDPKWAWLNQRYVGWNDAEGLRETLKSDIDSSVIGMRRFAVFPKAGQDDLDPWKIEPEGLAWYEFRE